MTTPTTSTTSWPDAAAGDLGSDDRAAGTANLTGWLLAGVVLMWGTFLTVYGFTFLGWKVFIP